MRIKRNFIPAWAFVLWALFGLFDLALLVGLIYVVIHFLSKVW